MNFDYYNVSFIWREAKAARKFENLAEAQTYAKDLKKAGAEKIQIYGVTTGKKESIEDKRKPYTPPKITVKSDKKTAVKTKAAGVVDWGTEKKAAQVADNIKKLGYNAEQVKPNPVNVDKWLEDIKKKPAKKKQATKKPKKEKPAPAKKIDETAAALERYRVKGSDDPFYNNDSWDRYDLEGDEKFLFSLTPDDLNYLNNALQRFDFPPETWEMVLNADELETTISNLRYEQKPVDLEFTGYEMAYILRALDNLLEKQKTTFFKNDIESLIMDFSR